jgi:hypothetical protein
MSEPNGKPEIVRTERGQFSPGVTGNAGGRPKNPPKKVITLAYEKYFADHPDELVALVKAQVQLAKSGKVGSSAAAKEIADRLEGKPAQSINIVAGGEPGDNRTRFIELLRMAEKKPQ